jgi:hypothetical protein
MRVKTATSTMARDMPVASVRYKLGLIASRALSLYLDDHQAATAALLFGGDDIAKFIEDYLVSLNVSLDSAFVSDVHHERSRRHET